ncbi:XdhC family protein [Sorangium sp. So ce1182]|uniref:XdhC family protein n=1 Tax=Sorangium sp. So ce1182 TaxID=3133334 RepID=UPI003F5E70ED
MNEIRAVMSLWSEAVRDGKEAVLATVVSVEGSAYRRPGARMLLVDDGRRVGSVESGARTFACAGGLHSPIGLDLGGETPEEIALAILAEAQACLSGRRGRSLRDRPGGSIHEPAERAGELLAAGAG